MFDISVVIPNLNSIIIDKVVKSLLDQSTELIFEIIVVGQDEPDLIPENSKVKKIITQTVITGTSSALQHHFTDDVELKICEQTGESIAEAILVL